MWYDKECPVCKEEFEINAERWNGKTICPYCNTTFLWDFDFVVMDDGEEWDVPILIKFSESNYEENDYFLDIFESRKI